MFPKELASRPRNVYLPVGKWHWLPYRGRLPLEFAISSHVHIPTGYLPGREHIQRLRESLAHTRVYLPNQTSRH